jgi:LysM repeat protein
MRKATDSKQGRLLYSIAVLCLIAVTTLSVCVPSARSFAEEGKDARYTVRWGDTLAKLARRYYGDGKAYGVIADANRIQNPDRIFAGAVLVIPANGQMAVLPSLQQPAEKRPSAAPSVPPSDNVTVPGAISAGLPVFSWRKETNMVFGTRERLEFEVRWKFISVGTATMEIHGIEDVNGRQAYHIYSSARSSNFFDTFYKVRDTNESWMDAESLCSLKFASRISECGHNRTETVVLNHEKKQFRIEESGKTGDASQWAQDVLSSLYYLRTKELEVGKEYLLDAHSSDKSWPLKVRVVKREKVKVPAGEFNCYVVEPAIREGAGIFQAKGSLWVWLTADEKRVPVLMRSKIAVGSIEAQLKSMKLD